ncbi:MAG: hypothetical protein QNJ30_12740 [Kiloniellales bacterium]|nr:hypothetical protein [Kiloniellales bacterium]
MDFSSTQRNEILAALPETGWRLKERQRPDEWWADELWTLESVWRPQGRKAYLVFLVDPMWGEPRRFGQAVWAVAVGETQPKELRDLDSNQTVPIRPHWERDRDDLWALLRRLHDD